MDFLYSVLNFIGLLLYLVVILGIIRGLCTYELFSKKEEWRNTLLVIVLVVIAPLCGYFIRDFAQSKKNLIRFERIIERESSKSELDRFSLLSISAAFSDLTNKEKEEAVEIIFNKFYDNSLTSRCEFLDEYREFNIPFIINIKNCTESEIAALYKDIENSKDESAWKSLSKKINIQDFLDNAPTNILDSEFNKWKDDDSAWRRVMLLDSIILSHVYLERYPKGIHEESARKFILDEAYSKCEGRDRKITSNFSGTTTIAIYNRSVYKIDFHYDGTFAKGKIDIPKNSYREIKLPNGYYMVSIYSQKLHSKGIHERITCDGGCIPYDLELKFGR